MEVGGRKEIELLHVGNTRFTLWPPSLLNRFIARVAAAIRALANFECQIVHFPNLPSLRRTSLCHRFKPRIGFEDPNGPASGLVSQGETTAVR